MYRYTYTKTLSELKCKATQVKLFGVTCETNRETKNESYISFLSIYDQSLADTNSPRLVGLCQGTSAEHQTLNEF